MKFCLQLCFLLFVLFCIISYHQSVAQTHQTKILFAEQIQLVLLFIVLWISIFPVPHWVTNIIFLFFLFLLSATWLLTLCQIWLPCLSSAVSWKYVLTLYNSHSNAPSPLDYGAAFSFIYLIQNCWIYHSLQRAK